MALVVGRGPVTTEVWVRSQVIPCEVMYGGQALGQGFLRARWLSPASVIPPIFITRLHVRVGRSNGQSLGTFQQVVLFRKSGGVG